MSLDWRKKRMTSFHLNVMQEEVYLIQENIDWPREMCDGCKPKWLYTDITMLETLHVTFKNEYKFVHNCEYKFQI